MLQQSSVSCLSFPLLWADTAFLLFWLTLSKRNRGCRQMVARIVRAALMTERAVARMLLDVICDM